MATLFCLIQGFVIIRLLTPNEWGLVQLATSIGGALGIYQHLGLASASTREIAAADDDTKIFKIFVTSILIRYCITMPLSLGLIFFSGYISTHIYNHPELSFPLQIYGVTLFFQGFQSILNSVISGTKRFKQLFTYQVIIAMVSVCIYIPLVYFFKVTGWFYAFLSFNILSSIILSFLAFLPLKGKLIFPSKRDFKVLLKEIFSISIAIYIVKVIYTNWEKLGVNILGLSATLEIVAVYGFAIMFSKKILNISDAVTDVSLPVFSEKFVKDIKDFKETYSENFNKIFSFIMVASATAVFWAPQILRPVLGELRFQQYYQSLGILLPLLLAFIFYSFLDLTKSSVLIPAKYTKDMIVSFALLVLVTGGVFAGAYLLHIDLLYSMAVAMLCGAVSGFWYMCYTTKKNLNFVFFNIDHILIVIQFIFIGLVGNLDNLWLKSGVFIPLMFLLIWGLFVSEFVTKKELHTLKSKIFAKFAR